MIVASHHELNSVHRYLQPINVPPDAGNRTTSPEATSVDVAGNSNASSASNTLLRDSAFVVPLGFLVIVLVCLAAMWAYFRCERIHSPNRTEYQDMTDEENGRSTKIKRTKRTQEAIEKMLILKKVLFLDATTTKEQINTTTTTMDDSLSPSDSRQQSTIPGPRKSDLVILRRASNEEEADDSLTCSICLSNFEHGDTICYSRNQQCSHRFHASCAVAWFVKHDECPVCRADYLLESVKMEEGMITPMHPQDEEETSTTASALSRSIPRTERESESYSPFLTVLLGRNVNGRRQSAAHRSLESKDEAIEVTCDNGDGSSRSVSQGGTTVEDAPDNRIQSKVHGEAGAVSSFVTLRAFPGTTDTEQTVRFPSRRSSNV